MKDSDLSRGFDDIKKEDTQSAVPFSNDGEPFHQEIAFSEVFGMMIEDAVNVMNDINADYGELDPITEKSYEASSVGHQSQQMTKKKMEKLLVKSILNTIPSEMSGQSFVTGSEFRASVL